MNSKLEIYDTSRFVHDPKQKGFILAMNKYPDFALESLKKDRQKYLIYITLMYDKNSDLRLATEYTYWQKKKLAAEAAGFILVNDRFEKEVEEVLLSNNKDFLNAMIRYLRFQHNTDFIQLCVYEMLHDIILKQAILEQEPKLLKDATAITNIMSGIQETIFGGNETINAKEALYEKTGEYDLGIRPEAIAKKLEMGESFADFGRFKDYIPDDLEFIGDEI